MAGFQSLNLLLKAVSTVVRRPLALARRRIPARGFPSNFGITDAPPMAKIRAPLKRETWNMEPAMVAFVPRQEK